MKIYAISDLHLPGGQDKPMSIFGGNWDNHWQKIKHNWTRKIKEEDVVLIAGDTSWAMSIDDAKCDLDEIAALPGKHIFLKGNHDYWWSSITKVRGILSQNQYAIQNDCVKIDNIIFAGTRGWLCPGMPEYGEADEKIYLRESHRLALSIECAKRNMTSGDKLILMMHYPAYSTKREPNNFTDIIDNANPLYVIMGHIHTRARAEKLEGKFHNTSYIMTACDYIDFDPIEIAID